jgi:hypothetical protein
MLFIVLLSLSDYIAAPIETCSNACAFELGVLRSKTPHSAGILGAKSAVPAPHGAGILGAKSAASALSKHAGPYETRWRGWALILGILFLASCVGLENPSRGKSPPRQSETPEPTSPAYEILEHGGFPPQGEDAGEDIPLWVRIVLQDGSVEELFPGYYCFVERNEGSSLEALRLWANGISVQQDLPRLAALRVQKRLAGLWPPQENPENRDLEQAFAHFFEQAVRMTGGGTFTNAHLADSHWYHIRYPRDDGGTADPKDSDESFGSLVLILVDSDALEQQLKAILNAAIPENPGKAGKALLHSTTDHFFEGF